MWSLWTLEQNGYSGWESILRPMIIATVNVQCTAQTLGSDNRYPGYYSKTHLAQSWQDNLFLWVQSRLECGHYDLLKQRKKKVQLSKGSISCSLCRQNSSWLQRECCLRKSVGPSPWGVSFPRSCCHSTFGGRANANTWDTRLNRWKKKCERAWRFACKNPQNSRKSV